MQTTVAAFRILTGDVADPGVVKVTAIDKNGFVLTQGATADIGTTVDIGTITVADRRIGEYPMRTAKKRQLRIIIRQVADLDDATKGRIVKVVIEVAGRSQDDGSDSSGNGWNRYQVE